MSARTDQPSSGVYLLSMEATAGSLIPSPPFYVILGHGAGSEALNAARDWSLKTYAVPEPASALIAIGALLAACPRMRSSHFTLSTQQTK